MSGTSTALHVTDLVLVGYGGLRITGKSIAVLEAVAEFGSTSKAAERLQVSFITAWNTLRTAEAAIGTTLVIAQRGGHGAWFDGTDGSRTTPHRRLSPS